MVGITMSQHNNLDVKSRITNGFENIFSIATGVD